MSDERLVWLLWLCAGVIPLVLALWTANDERQRSAEALDRVPKCPCSVCRRHQ